MNVGENDNYEIHLYQLRPGNTHYFEWICRNIPVDDWERWRTRARTCIPYPDPQGLNRLQILFLKNGRREDDDFRSVLLSDFNKFRVELEAFEKNRRSTMDWSIIRRDGQSMEKG